MTSSAVKSREEEVRNMKLFYASEGERRAAEWAMSAYGRSWGKQIDRSVSEMERTFPYPNLKHFCSRPFGRRDWNCLQSLARNCYRRNKYFPSLAKQMARDAPRRGATAPKLLKIEKGIDQ